MRTILLPLIVAALAVAVGAALSPETLQSNVTLFIDNDLQDAQSKRATSGTILLSPRSMDEAIAGCEALGEEIWGPELVRESIQYTMAYLEVQWKFAPWTEFWVAPIKTSKKEYPRIITIRGGMLRVKDTEEKRPVLCTETAPYSSATEADTSEKWQMTVHSNGDNIVGFRDRFSFRFLGVRYAPQPKRFTHSVPYKGNGSTVDATKVSEKCVQEDLQGSEDCLFLNIWTTYLPRQEDVARGEFLKPVMFWIHGGAFTGGTGSDSVVDGGSLASRGDVVVVSINYRLGTLGFLALDDGETNGNFGLGDQINALDWVRANIKDFGGDPDKITIFGQSAGAASVRAMMSSTKALGKFAAAIPMSNLGGLNYGAPYSRYYTIPEEVEVAAKAILKATNCADAPSQVDCLRDVPATTLAGLDDVARYLVVDGTYITSKELQLNGPELPFKLMMGITADDGAPMIQFPETTDQSAYLSANNFTDPPPHLFPIPDSANKTLDLYNMSSTLATDAIFRCVDQATVYAGLKHGSFAQVYYYEFGRTYQTVAWPKTDVCEPPKTSSHPHGDPSLPYFRCHSGELYYVFGNLAREGLPFRDRDDLPFAAYVIDTFSSFARTFDPNPDLRFLDAKGYHSTQDSMALWEPWAPSTKGDLTMRLLQWPYYQGPFKDVEQCEGLGLGYNYYG